ncbi:hypothetical protein F7725_000513 [Dissostichus mawsoni]|uniref:G-protein coupled receptors family 3 profile domain-containing protein n=1 Tax=Dissostichus mawsoni TaxID=36200 RepID=A0A7J5ZIV9_DISMA|nr:hypothetical protein F7725_000513 [Dissostichus mawsoni]
MTAEALIESAIQLNFTNKVWIADEEWSLNKNLPKIKGIRNIGTVIGISEQAVKDDFIYSSRRDTYCETASQNIHCNQVFNRSSLSAEDVVAADPSFNFPVYTAVYAIAHALHNALQCGSGRCNDNITVFPHMIRFHMLIKYYLNNTTKRSNGHLDFLYPHQVLAELKKSNFTLLNESIRLDENGDPNYGSYSVVFWNHSGDAEEIGFYTFYPSVHFFINNSKIQWYANVEVPTSVCSLECPVGFSKKQDANDKKCCFDCEICPNGTYRIPTGASTVRTQNSLQQEVHHATCGRWRSAGGPMCFLILVCLSLCSISVFFCFGEPTTSSCILRFLPFLLFYTVCLACFVMRSFQIGQWLVITVAFGIQALLLLMGYSLAPLKPFNETIWYPDKIILGCDLDLKATSGPVLFLLSL